MSAWKNSIGKLDCNKSCRVGILQESKTIYDI